MKQLFTNNTFKLFITVLIITSIATLAAYFTYGQPKFGIDDANITFVYAKNLANGNGIVYNTGGEHVEGSSTMLWVLVCSIAYKFFSSPEFVILIISFLSVVFVLTYFLKFLIENAKSRFQGILFSSVFLSWIFAIPNYIVWSTITLMEFGLYSAIILGLTTATLKNLSNKSQKLDKIILTVFLVSVVLIRPEGLLWSILFLGINIFGVFLNLRNIKNTLKVTYPYIAATILSILGLISFRLIYFGYPVPNTYYAKVSNSLIYNFQQGYEYILKFINSNSIAFFLVLLTFASLIFLLFKFLRSIYKRRNEFSNFEIQFFGVVLIVGTGIFIPIYNGGDHFNQFRFIQPIWPILILPVFYLYNLINSKNFKLDFRKSYTLVLISSFVFIFFYTSNEIQWDKYKEQKLFTIVEQFDVQSARDFGSELNEVFAPLNNLPSIGVLAAGGFKMTYNGYVNDLLGLNNVEMAHASGDRSGYKGHAAFNKEVLYKQKPDIFVIGKVQSFEIPDNILNKKPEDFSYNVLKGIYDDQLFKEIYKKATILANNKQIYMFGYYTQDFLNSLPKEQFTVKTYE